MGTGGRRVDENVKPLTVQHQPGHYVLELLGLEDDVELGDRMRASGLVAEWAFFPPRA
jgi:hypothetical protein